MKTMTNFKKLAAALTFAAMGAVLFAQAAPAPTQAAAPAAPAQAAPARPAAGAAAPAQNQNGQNANAARAASNPPSITDQNPMDVMNDTGVQSLTEVNVDMFEREGSWNVSMGRDDGYITSSVVNGGPEGRTTLPQVGDAPIPADTKILGVKVQFYHRGIDSFYIRPIRPLPVEGVVKTISVWVAGRNQPHHLLVQVQDYNGKMYDLDMGTLDFSGWKQLMVSVPPSPDGRNGIVQDSPYFGDKPGLKIVGFRIDCDPQYAIGTYYVYFDDLRAVTDLYNLTNPQSDDPQDTW
jgi:hypothetical protein